MVQVTATYQPGDQVQQAPAAPPPVMTVLALGVKGDVECEWYANGVRNSGWFPASSLHLAAKA